MSGIPGTCSNCPYHFMNASTAELLHMQKPLLPWHVYCLCGKKPRPLRLKHYVRNVPHWCPLRCPSKRRSRHRSVKINTEIY